MNPNRRIFLALILCMLAVTQLGSSCATTSSDDRGSGHGDNDRDSYPDYDRPNRIPRWSDLVQDGHDKLRWEADLDGDVYVYDVDRDHIVYNGPVRRGQELVVSPDKDKIYVDGRVVYDQDMRRDGRHQVFFARPRGAGYDKDHDRDRDRDRDKWNSNTSDLPRDARKLISGKGNLAINAASDDGTVYVYDEDDRRVVCTQDLRKGNSFQIFPGKDYVNVNSRRTATVRLADSHRFTLYFGGQRF